MAVEVGLARFRIASYDVENLVFHPVRRGLLARQQKGRNVLNLRFSHVELQAFLSQDGRSESQDRSLPRVPLSCSTRTERTKFGPAFPPVAFDP